MKCETVREHLIDLWRDALGPESRAEVERHLTECSDCDDEHARLGQLWTELGRLDGELAPPVPSERLRSRFYRALAEHERELARPPIWRRARIWLLGSGGGVLRTAPSMPALVLGVTLGVALMWGFGAHRDIRRLSAEVDSMNRAVSLSLLAHQSASERLRGVTWSSRALTDDRIVDALLVSLRHDPNVNVRLAAMETLASVTDSPRIRAGLAEALPDQASPVLQVALVQILSQENGGGAEAIQQLLNRKDLDEEVRSQIGYLLQSV